MAATTSDFNMKRITITIPEYLYSQIQKQTKPGEVSGFVVDAIQSKVGENIVKQVIDPWDEFFNAYKVVTKKNKISIRDAINRGRL